MMMMMMMIRRRKTDGPGGDGEPLQHGIACINLNTAHTHSPDGQLSALDCSWFAQITPV